MTAGVSDADWAEYQADYVPAVQAVKDCASQLGLPTLSDVGSIGSAIANWRASWNLEPNDHLGQISLQDNPDFSMYGDLSKTLTPNSDHSGTAKLNVDLLHDEFANDAGTVVTNPMTVVATVTTAPPPDLSVLTGAIAAGIAGPLAGAAAILALLSSWLESTFGFDASTSVMVSYRQPTPGIWRGTLTATFGGMDNQATSTSESNIRASTADQVRVTGQFSSGLAPGSVAFWAENVHDDSTGSWSAFTHSFFRQEVNIPQGGFIDFESVGIGQSSGSTSFDIQGGLGISVEPTGQWSVQLDDGSGVYAVSQRGFHSESKITSNFQGNSDTIDNDPAGALGSFSSNGSASFSGQFDPAHPPSVLQATIVQRDVQLEGVDGTLTQTLNLDFGQPITVP